MINMNFPKQNNLHNKNYKVQNKNYKKKNNL